jgi:hypothetical protein
MSKKWYQAKKTKIRGYWLPKPYNNIFIGSDPRDGADKTWADQFNAIVNVSCTQGALFEPSRPEQRTYWYPVNEMGEWSYAYFIYMFKVLSFHHKKKHKIYVHCHAGAYRSPSIVRWWLVATQRKSLIEARNIVSMCKKERDPRAEKYSVYQNYILGNLPPNFQTFIERIRYAGVDANYVSLLLQPACISKTREVSTRRAMSLSTQYSMLKHKIVSPFKNAKDKVIRWKKGLIDIEVLRGCHTITDDWALKSKRKL